MNKIFDFSTAPEATASQGSTLVRPGTIDKFTVEKVEITADVEGKTDNAKVFFTSASGGFNHTFYITQGALPRINHLLSQFLRKPNSGQATFEQIVNSLKALEGTSAFMRVFGKLNSDKGTVYPDLPYGGFAGQSAEELVWSAKEQAQLVDLQHTFDNYKPKKEGEEAVAETTNDIF